ncbi:S1/P1 nuclease [Anatilimnocola floriformis]|uniref:S1/P1 nuclease n=1 Tax=Anatilimnocola floriformis TaxID=2948575 RepID=UPI0020C2FBAE|nr:S1/P1 nuclease [Anatilimnocola floriformis]
MILARRILISLIILLLIAPPAHAWNAVGHSVIAKIAYARLTPAERQKVFDVLKQHPHFKDYLNADVPTGADEQEWAFMRAAVWSDWVRPPRNFQGKPEDHPIHKFHRSTWHYINYPYKKGQTDLTLGEPLKQPFNAEQQIPLSVKFAKAGAGEDSGAAAGVTAEQNRAVRTCWAFHLIGDIHQPCHVTAFVDPDRLPLGDEGGNKTSLRVDIGAEPTKLHTLWDAMLGTDADPESIADLGASLLKDPALQPDKIPEAANGDVKAWVQESYKLSVAAAYLNGELPIVLWDDYKSGVVPIQDVPILPIGTEKKARAIARRQAVVAGQRLADKLREVIAE